MKIIQLHIYLLMCYQVTESLTNTAVTLGADVNVTCDLDIEEIYWYRQKSPDPPVLILRTYDSTYEKAKYENSIFKHKYSVKTNSRLFIRNISTDELGVYYCVKTSEPLKFSNGTKIYISDSVHRNQTESHDAPQHETQWRNPIIITSVLLNVFFIITLIGLAKSYLQSRRFKNSSENPQISTAAQYSNDSQYATVDFSTPPSQNRPCQEQSIYSLLQPIKRVLKEFILGSKRTKDSLKPFQNTNLQQPQVMDLTTSRLKPSAVCCGGPFHTMSKVSVQPSQQHLCASTAAEISNN